jgi:hypothetical protein|tara:strand:- start:246 stop:509 length:264 start_codon:yes stop_codon:yes gene_type:complete
MEQAMDSNLVEEIWTSISHYVPERQKVDCAVDYVKTLIDQGVDNSTLKAAMEYDEKLTEAIKIVLEDEVDDSYGLEDHADENNWHEE